MGNFEKLSVLVIVVIIVLILVVAIYTWSDNPDAAKQSASIDSTRNELAEPGGATPASGGGTKGWDYFESEAKEPVTPAVDEPTPPEEPVDPILPEDTILPDEPKKADQPADAPGTGEPTLYTVQAGDTLSQISERKLGTWRRMNEILELNPGLKAEALRVGSAIKLPPRGTVGPAPAVDGPDAPKPNVAPSTGPIKVGEWYVTKRGDRLERIAKVAYGTIDYWPELWARNLSTVSDPDDIPEGTRIYIVEIARR